MTTDGVQESFTNIEEAKEKLRYVADPTDEWTPRLIAEVHPVNGLKTDPHNVGGQKQAPNYGFNQYWKNWDDINFLMGLAQNYLNQQEGKIFRACKKQNFV